MLRVCVCVCVCPYYACLPFCACVRAYTYAHIVYAYACTSFFCVPCVLNVR